MATSLPTFEAIRALHQKYAPTADVFDVVFTHCQIVRDIALQLAQTAPATIDVELVSAGCLLHDIGAYTLYDASGSMRQPDHYITHGVRGEALLRQEHYPDFLCRFASHHTGAGITKRQIIERALPLPAKDYLAETIEEKLVMYADKFHSKSRPPIFNSHAYYAGYVQNFGSDSAANFARLTAMFGVPNLDTLAVRYGHQIREK